jgi:pimeloyl-ACP methyl ester carboxylesterase
MHTPEKKFIDSDRLSIEYLEWNPGAARSVVLVHGWPDAARTWSPDWIDVTLHSYRHRWGHAEGDPFYAADIAKLKPLPLLATPMLVIHDAEDAVNPVATSECKEAFFSGRYQRVVLDGVGHFPQREAPAAVAQALIGFFGTV